VELVDAIFQYLPHADRCRLAATARIYYDILRRQEKYWYILDLSGAYPRHGSKKTDDEDMHGLNVVEHAIMLLMKQNPFYTSRIRAVNLSYTNIQFSTVFWQFFAKAPCIEYLDLSFCTGLEKHTLAWLSIAKNLKKLNLTGCTLDDVALEFLPRVAPDLEELLLVEMPKITSNCLHSVVRLTKLRRLSFQDSLSVAVDWWPLVMNHSPLDDAPSEEIELFPVATGLKALTMPGNEDITPELTLALVHRYKDLEEIAIYAGGFQYVLDADGEEVISSEDGIAVLKILEQHLPKLRVLDMAIISELSIQHSHVFLSKMEELMIDACSSAFTHDSIQLLARHAPGLRSLCFYSNSDDVWQESLLRVVNPEWHAHAYAINDETMHVLANHCPRLRKLQIFAELLTERGLEHITRFKELAILDMTGVCLDHNTEKLFASKMPALDTLSLITPDKKSPKVGLARWFGHPQAAWWRLKQLTLFLDAFADSEVKVIGTTFTELESLDITSCYSVPLTLMAVAEGCKKLQCLKLCQERPPPTRIRSSASMQSAFLRLSETLVRLKHICIVGDLLTRTSFRALGDLPRLHTMILDRCLPIPLNVVKDVVDSSRSIRHLRIVHGEPGDTAWFEQRQVHYITN
jgi:hypothetical protein